VLSVDAGDRDPHASRATGAPTLLRGPGGAGSSAVAVKFAYLAIGSLFRFSGAGLPGRLADIQTLGPYRKVSPEEAVLQADVRNLRLYVAASSRVVPES
jgi:hypothetical protein